MYNKNGLKLLSLTVFFFGMVLGLLPNNLCTVYVNHSIRKLEIPRFGYLIFLDKLNMFGNMSYKDIALPYYLDQDKLREFPGSLTPKYLMNTFFKWRRKNILASPDKVMNWISSIVSYYPNVADVKIVMADEYVAANLSELALPLYADVLGGNEYEEYGKSDILVKLAVARQERYRNRWTKWDQLDIDLLLEAIKLGDFKDIGCSSYCKDAHLYYGIHLFRQKELLDAENELRFVLSLNGNDFFYASLFLGMTLFEQGKYIESVGSFDKAISEYKKYHRYGSLPYRYIALVAQSSKDLEKFEKYVREGHLKFPEDTELGELYKNIAAK